MGFNAILVAFVAVVLTTGCQRGVWFEPPLVSTRFAPLVLTERRSLQLPSGLPGNRLVSGWRFEERGDGLHIFPGHRVARLEFVQLKKRERMLVLHGQGGAATVGSTVRVQSDGVDLGSFVAAASIEIPVPAGHPTGRQLMEFEFSDPSGHDYSKVTLSAAAPRGHVEIGGVDIVQSGWSVVEHTRWINAGGRLVGEFVSPRNPGHDQLFAVKLDRGSGEAASVFEVRPSSVNTEAPVVFDVPLGSSTGLLRISLVAEGRGPPGRWRGLRLRQLGPAAVDRRTTVPNSPQLVVVYVLDALRADWVGHLGSTLGATPCIDRLAIEGAAFINHFSVAPNTGPATKSLFTGYGYLKGRSLPPESPPTLAEEFHAAGYRAASFSSNPHLSTEFGLTRGFDHVELLPLDGEHQSGTGLVVNDSAERVHAAALRWLDARREDERIFLYLHTLNPHNPYTPPEPHPSRFVTPRPSRVDGQTKTLVGIRRREIEVSADDEKHIRELYTAGVAYNDAEICGFVDKLRRRYPGEILLAITSDHGEELFEHNGVLHGYTLYDELLHVPLVMWWPQRIAPQRVQVPTNTLDLNSTLRSLVAPGRSKHAEGGEPLWEIVTGSADGSSAPALHFAAAPGLRWAAMARSDRWKLILVPRPRYGWGMGFGRGRTHEAEYVFNLADDPMEHSNRAGARSLEVEFLRSRLRAWQESWERRQPKVLDGELDEATRRRLDVLGYVE